MNITAYEFDLADGEIFTFALEDKNAKAYGLQSDDISSTEIGVDIQISFAFKNSPNLSDNSAPSFYSFSLFKKAKA